MFIDENFEDNMVFATEAANARAELKQVVEGYEAMKAALEEVLELEKTCNDATNTYMRLATWAEKQALKGLGDE